MRLAAGAASQVAYQLLLLRQKEHLSPPLEAGYAHALALSMKLSGELVPAALSEAASGFTPCIPARKRRASESLRLTT